MIKLYLEYINFKNIIRFKEGVDREEAYIGFFNAILYRVGG